MSDDEYGNEDTGGFGDGEYNEDALNDLEENEFAEVPSHLSSTHLLSSYCPTCSFSAENRRRRE